MFRRGSLWQYSGVVTTWKQGGAFGFIKDSDTGASFFCHREDLIGRHVDSLPEGFRVEFDTAMFEGRTKAIAVSMPGGAPIRNNRRDDRQTSGSGQNAPNHDRELSRLQGALRALSRTSSLILRSQMDNYRALLTIAHKKGIVVPEHETTREMGSAMWRKRAEEVRVINEKRRMAADEAKSEKSAAEPVKEASKKKVDDDGSDLF